MLKATRVSISNLQFPARFMPQLGPLRQIDFENLPAAFYRIQRTMDSVGAALAPLQSGPGAG
jgi:hypothetical protein